MKIKFSRGIWTLVVLLLAVALMVGCSGSEGPAGPQGPEGPAGP
jgi:hypothetical protein